MQLQNRQALSALVTAPLLTHAQTTNCTQIQCTLELSVLRHGRVAETNVYLKEKSLNMGESAEQLWKLRLEEREVCAEAEAELQDFPKTKQAATLCF